MPPAGREPAEDGPIRVAIVGAGSRGHGVYGRWALDHPDAVRIVAVVDPDPGRRAALGAAHAIPDCRRLVDTNELIAAGLDVQAAIVASPDRTHAAVAMLLLRAGLDVLVEKPMAVSLDELVELVLATRTAPGRLSVAHVLRYTHLFRAVHEIVMSGRLGDLVSVVHSETIGWWHMAHSYVRGDWAVAETSSPLILAKCCHDLDLLAWNSAAAVTRVASFGTLRHFRAENAPRGALPRCTDGCPVDDCPFDARRIYLAPGAEPWLVQAVTPERDGGALEESLRTGPYGRCVYHAGSNVVDHQVVAMERADGASMTLRFSGHGEAGARTMRYDGTRATLRGLFGVRQSLEIHDHGGSVETVGIGEPVGTHGGGDDAIMHAFTVRASARAVLPTDFEDAIESHLLAFAAEQARLEGRVVDMNEIRAQFDHATRVVG